MPRTRPPAGAAGGLRPSCDDAGVTERLARIFANATRLRLLSEYGEQPTSPSRIARRIGVPVNLVSYHTRVLARHGCVELVRTERRRGATEHFYRRSVPAIIGDAQWSDVPPPLRRALVHGTLDAVREDAKQAARGGGFDHVAAHASRIRLSLDEEALAEVADVLTHAVDAIDAIQAESRARGCGTPAAREVVILHFGLPSSP
jgi:DNA-binding transcriptional ArsR family regulator